MLSRGWVALCVFSLLQQIFAADTRGVAPIAPDPVNISQPMRHGKDYALIFATDEYNDSEWKHLSNPVNDGQALSDELSSEFAFNTELVTNATLDTVMKTLSRYQDKAYEPDDQLLIFFAGHGTYDPKNKRGFVVTSDSRHDDTWHRSYIDYAMLRETLTAITNCNHILLILDVCYGAAIDDRISNSPFRGGDEYRETDPVQLISRKMKRPSRLYLTSGGIDYVPDGRPGMHSPFTRKLLEALSSHGGKLGVLTMQQVRAVLEPVIPEPHAGEFADCPGGDFLFISAVQPSHDVVAATQTTTPPAPDNQTRSKPRAVVPLTQLKLADFNELFGLKIGAKTDDVKALLGEAGTERTEGGSFHDQDLIWTYRAGGTGDLKVRFDNQTKVVRSITFDAEHLPWLTVHGVVDSKLALLGRSSSDIEKFIGRPTMTYTSTVRYEGTGLDVEFFCPEYNRFKCSRITVYWAGQQP